jgi:hypothetical protein
MDILIIKEKPMQCCQVNMACGPIYEMVRAMTQNEVSNEFFLTVGFFFSQIKSNTIISLSTLTFYYCYDETL